MAHRVGWVALLAVLTALLLVRMEEPATAAEWLHEQPVPRVYVGVYLHDISNFELSSGTFDVDADVWVKWRGDFDPEEIRIANAASISRESLGVEHDGEWHSARWRVRGSLRGDFPVHDFPLDRQTIALQFELPQSIGELVPDLAGSGISSRFSVTDWVWESEFRPVVSTRLFPSDLGSIAAEGRPAEVRRVAFEVSLRRPITPVVLKLFLPLAVVGLIVFASLFVPPDSLQPRLTMCVTGLVACFAFQFSVSDVMPTVAYLTMADSLFIIVYVLSTSCVAAAVAGHVLLARSRANAARWVQRWMQIAAPVGIVLAVVLALPSPDPPPPTEPDELPLIERAPSSRPVVRIGTTTPLRVASSPAGFASYWALAEQRTEGTTWALHVDRVPRVENDAMRFLSDGTLEVTWRLRPGAAWSDGTPIHVEDLLLPLRAQPDPRVESARAVDERTVVIRWNERVAAALAPPAIWQHGIAGPLYEEQGHDGVRAWLGEAVRPGTGPYRITSMDDRRILAERNPHFPLTPAALERVELVWFESGDALLEALLAGELDMTAPNSLNGAHIEQLTQADRLQAVTVPSGWFTFLHIPAGYAPLADLRARRAVLEAIDREALAGNEWGAAGRVAHAPMAGALPPSFPQVPHAPDAARATLEELGLAGTEIPIAWSRTMPRSLVDGLERDLTAAGLVPRFEQVPNTWTLWRDGGFDGLVLHMVRADPASPIEQWWSLPMLAGRYRTDVRHAAWTDAEQALLEQESRALYKARREQLREQIHVRWAKLLPSIPLVFAGERVVVDRALRNWQRPPEAPFGWGLEDWAFDEEGDRQGQGPR